MSCPICSLTKNVVVEHPLWTVVLNDDQGYLGRCYFALKRHETDVTALTEDELLSLWQLLANAKLALDFLYRPDHYNYVFLMNVQPHLHAHIIPRYAQDRLVEGLVFSDGELGSHYSLNNTNCPPDLVMEKISGDIGRVLRAMEAA